MNDDYYCFLFVGLHIFYLSNQMELITILDTIFW